VSWCQRHPEVTAILVPPPTTGGTLAPVLCNMLADRLFLADDPATEDA
jgi:hypothetical protein